MLRSSWSSISNREVNRRIMYFKGKFTVNVSVKELRRDHGLPDLHSTDVVRWLQDDIETAIRRELRSPYGDAVKNLSVKVETAYS